MTGMDNPPLLSTEDIDRLAEALRSQRAPVVDRLAPGLSAAEMDEITAPLGLTLPDEARTWWGTFDGAPLLPGDGPHVPALSPAWWWAPLESVVAECLEIRSWTDPDFWVESWLPIVIGDGHLVIDTAVAAGEPSPVHVVDFEGDDENIGPSHIPSLASLGELVRFWTSAVEDRAIWFSGDRGYFEIDWDRVDQLGIPEGIL
jgi:hypothetical protein